MSATWLTTSYRNRVDTEHLGFREEMHPAPGFATLSRGDLHAFVQRRRRTGSRRGFSGHARWPSPRARRGWNRFTLEVTDLAAVVETLRNAGARFRNDIVKGMGGNQILLDDPSGNPIELFEPTIPEAKLTP